ncbi:hypothetical protein JW948_00860 [bacterium]|nr:hypothetical protein [bacterium]
MKRTMRFACLVFTASLYALNPDFHGQISGWGTMNDRHDTQLGLRAIPVLSAFEPVSESWTLDAEVSFQGVQWWQFEERLTAGQSGEIKPYRLWLRLASGQFEARIGLQKINFGPARLIRPLMWFDQLDPRDPLQLTDGIYALLLRYTFINNTNIWVWALAGNHETKGWESVPTRKDVPEWGGRLQVPAGPGETGISFHHREADIKSMLSDFTLPGNALFTAEDAASVLQPGAFSIPSSVSENRLGLDSRWDIVIGFWTECALVYLDWPVLPLSWQKMCTAGMDYTFGTGNGLYCQAEHFYLALSEHWNGRDTERQLTAVSVNYPLGLLDAVSALFFYDWDEQAGYRFLTWQRTTDRWQFHLIGFWNPDEFQMVQFQHSSALFTGKGLQAMLVFNF